MRISIQRENGEGEAGIEGGSQVGKRVAVSICRAPNFRRMAAVLEQGLSG